MNPIEAKMRIFFSVIRSFRERKLRKWMVYKGAPRQYGLVLMNHNEGKESVLVKITFWFSEQGEFDYKRGMGELGSGIDTMLVTDIDTILNLRRNEYKTKDGRKLPYDFETAVRFGEIRWRGEASTADIQRFRELLVDHPEVIEELVPKV